MEQRELHINGLLHNMEVTMSNFTIKDMLAMQQALQEKYKDKWEAYGENGMFYPFFFK